MNLKNQRRISRVLILFVFFSFATLQAQENGKSGWNLGVLPAVSYNTDLGFQYGGIVNFFNYGDGSRYPNYDHSLYFEASQYTKGSGFIGFAYDSDQLLKNMQLTLNMSYLPEKSADFYGFNGYESVYNSSWTDTDADDYRSRMFYKHNRDMWRVHLDLNGRLFFDKLRWAAGIEFYNMKVASVDIDRLNRGKSGDEKLPSIDSVPGLFEYYKEWNLIPENEQDGGQFFALKGGLMYDTRNFRPNPTEGIWTDAILYYTPKFTSNLDEGFLRLSLTHRQYFKLINNRLWFAYRLNWQACLAGHVPFYVQPLLITTQLRGSYSEGLGGSRSIRGVLRNRVVGNDIALGNFEFRSKIVTFRLWKQNFFIGINAFVDAGVVTRKINITNEIKQLVESGVVENPENFFDLDAEKIHWGAGGGIKIVMNENFIISGDFGLALDKQDGNTGIYIGLNYLF